MPFSIDEFDDDKIERAMRTAADVGDCRYYEGVVEGFVAGVTQLTECESAMADRAVRTYVDSWKKFFATHRNGFKMKRDMLKGILELMD